MKRAQTQNKKILSDLQTLNDKQQKDLKVKL